MAGTFKKLEKKFAKFAKKDYAVSVNTGTAGLHLACVALGIKEGDEVIVPDFTMAACGFAVSYTGAKVVTVDCDDSLNIDVTKIEDKITTRTKAIMPVHIYGRVCNMDEIKRIADKYSLYVIEDASEAHGAKGLGKAHLTVYSLYKNKIVNAEEGGIITIDDKSLKKDLDDLKNMSFGEKHNFFHERMGFNYRMADSQAALAIKSLAEVKKNLRRRKEIECLYDEYFDSSRKDVVWVYDIYSERKKKILKKVKQARDFFKPLSIMPMWKQQVGVNAAVASETGLYLPVDPKMTDKEIRQICKKVVNI